MTNEKKFCSVCGRKTNLFFYGVTSCSACRSFLSRALVQTTVSKNCTNGEICFQDRNRAVYSDCKICRFHKCVDLGMLNKNQKYTQLPKLFGQLQLLETNRIKVVETMTTCSNLCINDIFQHEPLRFIRRFSNPPYTFHDWTTICQLGSMEYIKQFQFMKFLSVEDVGTILKYAHFNHGIFSAAMISYVANREVIRFPNGMDIFPEAVSKVDFYDSKFLNRIRGRLIGRLNELKIRNEEFLLLGCVMICNPCAPNLSDKGKMLINSYQKLYSSNLFQYCYETYGKNGPSRFSELLSLCYSIGKTNEDIQYFFTLFQLYQPNALTQQNHIDIDLVQFLME